MITDLRWHGSSFASPHETKVYEPLPQALARAVELWADHPAVLHGDASFTFADLARRAAGLAEEIACASPSSGPVALVQSIGLDAVAAWFACTLAGRPFMLLEQGHPPARLRELMTAAGASLTLCDEAAGSNLPQDPGMTRLISDGRLSSLQFDAMLGAEEPAMIFPTSGSTGTPKLVTYASTTLQAKVQASIPLMRTSKGARVLIAGSHGNYGFLHHALVFLLSGGTLCLVDVKADGFEGLLAAIDRLNVRHVRFTPSMFRAIARLPEAPGILSRLEAVRFSGEPLLMSDFDLASRVLDRDCLIQNVYGSTESALFIWSKGETIDPNVGSVPIGRLYPLSSYALRPLDHVPNGKDEGELLIRSCFHALGDWQAGAVNPERFGPDPNGGTERIYATGDIVRQLSDGSLVLLGRANRMVKIRGQRVFLPEIENHLRAIPGVTGAVVIERDEQDGCSLFAFITLASNVIGPVDARAWLARRLPDFMLPRRILTTPDIPMLPGGKVDYSALLARLPAEQTEVSAHHPAFAGDYGRLELIWRTALGWGAHDPNNDFFALGGDSLKFMELAVSIEREFSCRLSIDDLVANPTLVGIARLLKITTPDDVMATSTGLRLRSVHPAQTPSLGVALAMPGWHGSAHCVPFVEAGLFPDHDVWAADYNVASGNLLDDRRWWRSALDIVEHIRTGATPVPRVIFGFSLGGSIAWLVGRLLAGSPQAPKLVVMVDAAPLHRIRAYRHADIDRALACVATQNAPRVLHLERASLAAIGLAPSQERLWRREDGISLSLELPTTDHIEMGRAELLALVAEQVRTLAMNPSADRLPPISTATSSTKAGLVYQLLVSGDARGSPQLEELAGQFTPEIKDLGTMLHLVLRDGSKAQARAVLEQTIAAYPGSRLWHYAYRRLEREPEALCPSSAPITSLLSIAAIERALAAHQAPAATRDISVLKRFYQVIDMMRAIVAAAPARW